MRGAGRRAAGMPMLGPDWGYRRGTDTDSVDMARATPPPIATPVTRPL